MKRVEIELKVKMIIDVKNDHDLSNIQNEIILTDIEVDEDISVLGLKIIDSEIKKIF